MLKVLPVKREDFEMVYPLLTQIPSPIAIAKETWRRLFDRQWDSQIEPLGYVLMKESEAVGYIGLLTVKREIDGQRHEIMNLTSWTVKKQYSGHSIKLIFPFIQDQARTLTCFTPAKSVDVVFRRFGFQELNSALQVIPFWAMSFGRNDYEIFFDIAGQRSLLTKEEGQIYNDHRSFSGSTHFIIKKAQDHCYVVAKRVLKKKLPFLHVHYVSDKKLFVQGIKKFVGAICCRSRVLGLIVFEHYLGSQELSGTIKVRMQSKPLFRSAYLKQKDMDSLYSEFFVLDF